MALTTIAMVTPVAAPQAAEARGGGVAAGIAGGLIGGAIGGALAAPGYYGPGYYGYGPGYYGAGYGYYGPGYVATPGCYWQRQRFWDGFGWRLRNIRVCG